MIWGHLLLAREARKLEKFDHCCYPVFSDEILFGGTDFGWITDRTGSCFVKPQVFVIFGAIPFALELGKRARN